MAIDTLLKSGTPKQDVHGELLHEVELAGKTIDLRPEVLLSRPLGVAAFQTRAGLRALRMRRVGER